MISPTKKAEEILLEYWTGGLPVNPVFIANKLGIDVYKEDLGTKLAKSVIENNKFTITVGSGEKISSHRFFIAHCIGHILLEHLSKDKPIIEDTKSSFSSSNRNKEKDANTFALALLLPERLVKTWFDKMIGTDITEAAKMFDVAEAAVYQRLIDLRLIKEWNKHGFN